jgi:hypothetical protein
MIALTRANSSSEKATAGAEKVRSEGGKGDIQGHEAGHGLRRFTCRRSNFDEKPGSKDPGFLHFLHRILAFWAFTPTPKDPPRNLVT